MHEARKAMWLIGDAWIADRGFGSGPRVPDGDQPDADAMPTRIRHAREMGSPLPGRDQTEELRPDSAPLRHQSGALRRITHWVCSIPSVEREGQSILLQSGTQYRE